MAQFPIIFYIPELYINIMVLDQLLLMLYQKNYLCKSQLFLGQGKYFGSEKVNGALDNILYKKVPQVGFQIIKNIKILGKKLILGGINLYLQNQKFIIFWQKEMLKTSEKEWWAVIYENSNEQFSGERKKMKYSKIFLELQNKRVENFDFDGNYEPKILLHLKDIELKCLKTLNISKNNIDSIQVLCRINIPALEELYLYQNSIITLNTLRKSLIPALKYLALYDNPIHSFKPVLEMNSSYRQSMRVNFEIYYGNVNGCAGNWIFKLNTVSTQNMKMGSQKIFAKNIGTPAASELLNLFADFL